MTADAYWVRLGGRLPATEIAPHTAPTWETLADGGIGEVSFEFALSPNAQHRLLATGVKVEVMLGAQVVATALMSEPDRTDWSIKAQGLSAASRRIAAVNSLGEMTRDVGQVIQNVTTTTGWWDVTNPYGVGGGKVVTGDSVDAQMVGTLLDDLAAQEGQRWGADKEARLFMRSDPTSATCMIAPGAVTFGTTDEQQATQLVARYESAAAIYETRFYPAVVSGRVTHELVDLTSRGVMTATAVDDVLAGMLALGKADQSWTNGATLSQDQITRNGVPVCLPLLTAGVDMARVTGQSSGYLSSAPWYDVVIGKTRYTAGEDTIYLEPVNTAPRNFTDVISAA